MAALTKIYPHNSFDLLCYGNTPKGSAYRQAVKTHTVFFASAHLADNPAFLPDQMISIIAIPRGGMATADGLQEAFSKMTLEPDKIRMIVSQCKTISKDLYPKEIFEKTTSLVIADGIIGTGKTVIDHLKEIPREWKGTITIFANAAAEIGIESIRLHAVSMNQFIKIIVGRLFNEKECDWIISSHKKVYSLGYNKEQKVDYQLPDFGDYFS